MRYTLKRDDMPLLSQWIKNSTSRNLSNFLAGAEGKRAKTVDNCFSEVPEENKEKTE